LIDERVAVRVVQSGDRIARVVLAVRALRSFMRNPADTRKVLFLARVMNDSAAFLRHFRDAPGAPELLRERPAIDQRTTDFDALRRLTKGTLGRAFVDHLDARRLRLDVFQAPPELPPDEAYAAQRHRQTHDLWHVLTGFDTDAVGEVGLQAFSFAQTHARAPALIAVVVSLRHLRDPRLARAALRGYRMGRRAHRIAGVRWECLWDQPVAALRQRFGIVC